jgi:hypothetical protein
MLYAERKSDTPVTVTLTEPGEHHVLRCLGPLRKAH